ncbi:MAG: DUF2061 domain-containing protein [Oscillospiraceae bacterium]|nr:DUF2061 domain-containing protein [Oscillospiraceae bacterium]
MNSKAIYVSLSQQVLGLSDSLAVFLLFTGSLSLPFMVGIINPFFTPVNNLSNLCNHP